MIIPQSAQEFGLFDALAGRRSRRVGLGAVIPDGPLKYESPFEPVPLSDDERALLAFASLGVTGFNLGMPHTASGDPEAGANYIVRYLGRTAPSGAGIESSEVLITDDSGTYISQTRNLSSDTVAAIAESRTLEDYVGHAKNNLVKLSDEPVRLPAEWGFIDKHNWWTALQPGTTLIVPILDSSEYGLNLLSLLSGEGTLLWDDVSDKPVGKPEKLLESGHLNPEAKVPYSFFESYLYKMANHELSLIPYNAQLALQAAGLGGWLYGGINVDALLGGFAEQGHKGFGFTYEQAGPFKVPNPVGLPEYFETLAPPFVSSPREAVEKFIARKFGPNGIYETGQGPYKDQRGITSQIQRTTDEQIEYFISVVEEIYERDGRYPGSGPTVLSGIYTQATHIDPEYYATFHNDDALLETHRNHFHDWHGGELPKRRN
nr:Uncharacterised protein [Streptococcus thermophilus]